jgi:hypothetical protein
MRYRACAVLLVLAAAACSTPQSRIRRRQGAFDAYPPEVREKIRAGQVDVGFTREQVSIALGRPDRVRLDKPPAAEREIWVYGIGAPRPESGLVSAPGAYVQPAVGDDELLRVVFQKGAVVKIEKRIGGPP